MAQVSDSYMHGAADFDRVGLRYAPCHSSAAGGPKVAVTEVDLYDYPGMWLTGSDDQPALDAKFAPYPVKETKTRDRKLEVTETADYIADTEGKRAFPWRLLVIAEKDGDLVETDIVFRLSPEQQLQDTSWLKPGKIAWDWWNALNVTGVDFKSGVNTESYKHYIDFAAENGIEYIILDEGWSPTEDLLKEVPDVNVPELVAYGDKKGVRLILWCVWLAVDKQLEEAFQLFHTWGIAGAKIDFMDRDDQKMVDYYWRVTREAARYKLLVDYHGAYKPTGLRRAWPNLMTREGVIGLEYNKWSEKSSPENALCIPFIRMLAGPMDYTPGAMRNAQKANFKPIFERPMSQGTRCHQLAMYVVYESPLQMLSDTPSNYRRYPDILNFIAAVPTIWDETKVLSAKAGDYIIVARQSGNDWYMGAMTDWTARTLTVDFLFLEDDVYNGQIFQDGLNADRHAEDYKFTECKISKSDQMQIKLAPGGGWAAKITK